jgi:hypothetical protein
MSNGPTDLIIGSESLREHRALINYETLQVRYMVEDLPVYVPFQGSTSNHEEEAAVSLYASKAISIPAGKQMMIPVNASIRTPVAQDTWGLVANSGEEVDFIVAKMHMPLCRHQNWVQVTNLAATAITVNRGTRVARFHRHDKDSFNIIIQCDLDTLDAQVTAATKIGSTSQTESPATTDKAFVAQPHLTDIGLGDTLESSELTKLKRKILQYHHLWDRDQTKHPAAHGVECTITLDADPSTLRSTRRHKNSSPVQRQAIAKAVAEQKAAGIIQDSCSPYSSTVLLVNII